MGLNIKSERVHQLAKDAAARTGKTQTGAIEEALEMLLRRHGADPEQVELARRRERIDVILAEMHAEVPDPDRAIETTDDLYDPETGLPA
ncbi:type II toxin-antitoxin system VapB family antitoxin [Nocardioides mangrovicus]|uniref:type II toxin-antitoxin system VapB family antitoxin n=1 Tax=Nocardioides mangrovicus TaxID=2478913 RepID=UPI001313F13E|nr:type II toxin-antitoxin system VapB family antitoxin [Nocardioides mangrovicus]